MLSLMQDVPLSSLSLEELAETLFSQVANKDVQHPHLNQLLNQSMLLLHNLFSLQLMFLNQLLNQSFINHQLLQLTPQLQLFTKLQQPQLFIRLHQLLTPQLQLFIKLQFIQLQLTPQPQLFTKLHQPLTPQQPPFNKLDQQPLILKPPKLTMFNKSEVQPLILKPPKPQPLTPLQLKRSPLNM
jgi:hypothetical protein